MDKGLFITGTDTGVGKTVFSTALIRTLRAESVPVVGYKPVAAGAVMTPAGWRNDDAEHLLAVSGPGWRYEEINPCCLPLPASPHIAAQAAGLQIDLSELLAGARRLQQKPAFVVTEGAGGWRVPLSPEADIADLARLLEWPVILVVGLRLGCINHARLTAEAIAADSLPLAGWVLNPIDPDMPLKRAVTETLQNFLTAPMIAALPFSRHETVPEWTSAGKALLEAVAKKMANSV